MHQSHFAAVSAPLTVVVPDSPVPTKTENDSANAGIIDPKTARSSRVHALVVEADGAQPPATTQTGLIVKGPRAPAFDADDLEHMADVLDLHDDYRVLRRLRPAPRYHLPDGTPTLRGIYPDVETTGLDAATDEVVELGLVPFDYSRDGRIFDVHPPFDRFRDPARPIPAAVTDLTGITDDMVAGSVIEAAEIEAFIGPAVLVIAHNAGFDRKFVERLCPAFASLAWGCSWRDVPWAEEGFDGAKLAQLAAGFGFFHHGHRACHDCHAGIDILSRDLPRSGRTGLAFLLESARSPRHRVWATGAPFEMKDRLKARGYRWADGSNGGRRAWHIEVREAGLETELRFLRRDIFGRDEGDIHVDRITAFDRYSDRA
ncbi:MAG: 3'-5' exonuclease [Hyphomicrobium sp.]